VNSAGLVTPNYGQMGTEMLPSGNRMAAPYGQAPATSAAPTDSVMSMQGPQGPAHENYGYRPAAGRADRLQANIVGGTDFDNLASGGYSGGATQRI
jgi:hypothetical protein